MKTLLLFLALNFNAAYQDSSDTTVTSKTQIVKLANEQDDDIEYEGLYYLLAAPVYVAVILLGIAVFIFLANSVE